MDRRLARAIGVLAASGEILALYLTYVHYRLHREPGWRSACDWSAAFNCDAVISSRLGEMGGVPLPILGAWFYAVVFSITTFERRGRTGGVWRSAPIVLLSMSALGAGFSVVLAVASVGVQNALCPLCLLIDLVNIGLLILSWRAVRSTEETVAVAFEAERRHCSRSALGLVALAFALATLLVAHVSYSAWTAGGSEFCGVLAAALHSSARPLELKVYSDFQCSYCKALAHDLQMIHQSSDLQIVELPFPLDETCNPAVRGVGHAGACLQARAALCADAQGQGTAFSERLFDNGLEERSALVETAARLGLDRTGFDRCFDSENTVTRLDRLIREARDLGVRATPTVLVKGWSHVGRL
ncbi:MAG TPA: vitamin K epoxide reductase family protein, partial [Polyangiaceae bacterium]|nr:vitamin K epoxide reductase family protein [Polyangiaceae bacterium]